MTPSQNGIESIESDVDWSQRQPSIAVVEAIAAVENVEPADVTPPLHNDIDPTALDSLMESGDTVSVFFRKDEYQIKLDPNQLTITFE